MSLIRLLPPAGTFATGVLTFSGNAADGETVVIGSRTYTFKSALTPAANEVLVGANAAASIVNLKEAIGAGANGGTDYAAATTVNTQVWVSASDATTLTVKSLTEGPDGDLIATTETMGSGAWGAATLTGGGTSATNSAPSGATAGVALPHCTDRALFFLKSLLGSGTMTVTCKLWGYHSDLGSWFPLGVDATAANKGLMNAGNAMGETSADKIRHCEEITSLRKINRVYIEITAIGGTATEVAAYLDCVPATPVSES